MLFKAIAVKERYKDPAGKVIGYKIRDYLNQKDTLVSEDQLINAIKEDLVEPVNFKLTGNEGSELVYINGSKPLGTQFESRDMIDHGLDFFTDQSDPKQRYVVYKPLHNIFRHEWFLMDEQQNTYNICKEYARGVLKLCSEICADGSIEAFEFANFGLTIYLIDMLMKNGKVIEIENEERHYIFPNFAVDDHTKLNIYFDCTELSEVNVRCEVLEAD